MGKKDRHPIRIAFPVPSSDFGAKLMIFLFCDEIELQAQGTIKRYQEENPGLERKSLIRKGSSVPLLKTFTSEASQGLLKDIYSLSSGRPFSLVIINHENCSEIYYSEGKFPVEDFEQSIDMRDKLPRLLHEFRNLFHLSLYGVERADKTPEEERKVRHLGDYF